MASSQDPDERQIHAIVHGRVQGVSFRAYTQREAEALSLRGSVWNRRDGTVELRARGGRVQVQRFVDWLAHGPATARVTQLDVDDEPLDERLAQPFMVDRDR
jgi:acylphosphatase